MNPCSVLLDDFIGRELSTVDRKTSYLPRPVVTESGSIANHQTTAEILHGEFKIGKLSEQLSIGIDVCTSKTGGDREEYRLSRAKDVVRINPRSPWRMPR